MKNKNCHGKKTAHCYIITSLLPNLLKQRLINVNTFKLSKSLYSRSVLFKPTNNFGSGGTAVAQWLRRCATNRKVAGSIPDGVLGIFH